MKNISRHTGILKVVKREQSSSNGNPRYCIIIDGITCYTAPDSMIAYGITNHDDKLVEATIGTYYGKPTINSVKVINH